MTYAGYPSGSLTPPTASRWADSDKPGSPWQQAMVGVLGVVLALTLVIGQVAVATTAGISRNLHANIKHLEDGNKTMKTIIERAGPTVLMEQVVRNQELILANTQKTLGVLNGHMGKIGATTAGLGSTVGTMQSTSGELATGVQGMNSDTQKIVGLLEPLPVAIGRTHTQLGQISTDAGAINGELNTISGKMIKYGLPHAKKVRQ